MYNLAIGSISQIIVRRNRTTATIKLRQLLQDAAGACISVKGVKTGLKNGIKS